MAKPQNSGGSGTVTVAAAEVQKLLMQATGLPTTFFISVQKAKVLADGSLEAKYNFSTEGQPPVPTQAEEETPA